MIIGRGRRGVLVERSSIRFTQFDFDGILILRGHILKLYPSYTTHPTNTSIATIALMERIKSKEWKVLLFELA